MHSKHIQGRVILLNLILGSLFVAWSDEVIPVHLFACRGSTTPSSSVNGDKAEFQSHSDSLRSRLNAVSARYDFVNCNGCANCIFLINLFDINLSCH